MTMSFRVFFFLGGGRERGGGGGVPVYIRTFHHSVILSIEVFACHLPGNVFDWLKGSAWVNLDHMQIP